MGQMLGRIRMKRLVRNPTIQYIIINLHTKYDYSSLHGFTEIFNKNFIIQSMERKKKSDKYRGKKNENAGSKYGKKENGTNAWKNKHERLVYSPMIQYIIINLHTKYD